MLTCFDSTLVSNSLKSCREPPRTPISAANENLLSSEPRPANSFSLSSRSGWRSPCPRFSPKPQGASSFGKIPGSGEQGKRDVLQTNNYERHPPHDRGNRNLMIGNETLRGALLARDHEVE